MNEEKNTMQRLVTSLSFGTITTGEQANKVLLVVVLSVFILSIIAFFVVSPPRQKKTTAKDHLDIPHTVPEG